MTRLWYASGTIELDHAKGFARLTYRSGDELDFNLATDKPRLVNHYSGVFANLTALYEKGEGNQILSKKLHHLLFAAASSK